MTSVGHTVLQCDGFLQCVVVALSLWLHSCLGCHVLIGALIVIRAVGASLLLSSSLVPCPAVVWSSRLLSQSWCPPHLSLLPWVPPAHSRGRGCPLTRHHGHVVSPHSSSSWSWCPPPLVLKGVGAYVCGVHPTPHLPPAGCGCGGRFVVS